MKSAFRFTFVTVVACFSSIAAANGVGGIGVAGGYFGALLLWVFLSLILAFFWYKKTGLGWVWIHCPLILLSLVQAKTIGLIIYTYMTESREMTPRTWEMTTCLVVTIVALISSFTLYKFAGKSVKNKIGWILVPLIYFLFLGFVFGMKIN